ncbi:hypothetical protein G9A89_019197 [Geosiphon pyriformis]|nr:hypothetical protein G9A89_019197 [Geosiphon pyriformis]
MSHKSATFSSNVSSDPELVVRWFHAVDIPRLDPNKVPLSNTSTLSSNTSSGTKDGLPPVPSTKVSTIKQPSVWVPFSRRDSAALEQVYLSNRPGLTVPVNEDYLFEVDIDDREIYPVYWPGPAYEVRRGTWFYQGDGTHFLPCDENMAQQIETGYMKHQPWILPEEEIPKDAESPSEAKKKPASEKSWALLGRYLSQYVVYSGPTSAWLLSDDVPGKLAKTFYAKVTMGVNLGGTRLLRGYYEVELFETKRPTDDFDRKKKEDPEKERYNELTKEKDTDLDLETVEIEDYDNHNEEEERTIDHLVLVIHGIGQKLCETMESINFVHDVNVLRRTIKTMYSTNPPPELLSRTDTSSSQKRNSTPLEKLPRSNGIQVLPIQWRQEIKFGMANADQDTQTDLGLQESEEGQTTLLEITLEGVPTLRMMISDVLMDVLLYMTPKYREQMVNTVTKECNRVYGLFLERNPRFLEIGGKVSIYGHSLGSVLAFDILCHQPPLLPSTPGIFDERNNPELQKIQERLINLEFPVANFFAVGSPIGLFLMLKGLKIGSRGVPLCYPAVRNLYNIFHRADPIAYRLEPLVARHYGSSLKPALIPYHKGGLKAVHLGIQEFGSGIANKANNMFSSVKNSLFSFGSKSKTLPSQNSRSVVEGEYPPAGGSFYQHTNSFSEREKEDPDGAAKLRSLNITGRIDYCLQEGILDLSYLNAITVHLSYWSDCDAAFFILRECYREMEDEEEESLRSRAFNLYNLRDRTPSPDSLQPSTPN